MSKQVDEALDGIREALNELLEQVARELEGCGRYEPTIYDKLHGTEMEAAVNGSWLDREDVLASIRRLAR